VTPCAVGVIVYKVVGNRFIEKRVNVRTEHIKHSKCRQEFLARVKTNHAAHVDAREKGGESYAISCPTSPVTIITERVNLKRIPAQPREAYTVSTSQNAPHTITPVPYETTI